MRKVVLFMLSALLVVGCNTTKSSQVATNSGPDEASIKLAEAATSISQSLTDLKSIEKASNPPINNKRLPYPTSYDMGQLASVNWSGPIEPLLQRVATLTDFQLRVIGRRPAIPVLVTIDAHNTPVGYIVRDANFQAGTKASINVYPGIHVLELRYGKA